MLDENIPGPQRRGLPRNRDGGRRTFTGAIWAPILAEPCALLAALPTHPPHPPRLRDLPDRPTILSSVSISVDFCWRMSQGYLSARGGGKSAATAGLSGREVEDYALSACVIQLT